MNSQCDPQCNSTFCSEYEYGSGFDTPYTLEVSGQLYAADNFQCPYAQSSDSSLNYSLCTQSAADSIYIDPNLSAEQYGLCQAEWIGDGIC